MSKQINLEFKIEQEALLLEFLYQNIKDKSKNNIKSLLSKKNTYVNGKNITKFDYQLKKGDLVEIKLFRIDNEKTKIDILYEDDGIIVVNKPSGLLSISTLKEKEKTMYHLVSDYIKKNNPKNRIFIVHRLDKDTSGIIMFCKSEKLKNIFQDNWDSLVKTREYIAIVEGNDIKESGTIKTFLKENSRMLVYATNKEEGKEAITHYKKIKQNEKYTMLEVKLDTGRKNQIRVHMNTIGTSVIGDPKYGSTTNPIKRLGLHANVLEFIHPITKKVMRFETQVPEEFNRVFKK